MLDILKQKWLSGKPIQRRLRRKMENNEKHIRPDWDTYFTSIASIVSTRSTCLRRRYGAVIVKDGKIISTGYNGAPKGEPNCCDLGECERQRLNIPSGQNYEKCVAVHAEMNAVIQADAEKLKNANIYISGFNADGTLACGKPCLLCRRILKNAGVNMAYFYEPDRECWGWHWVPDLE
jgi:dCMP deaminase